MGEHSNLIGTDPGRFVEIERLGEGAEGGTWVAHDRHHELRRVTLKRVPVSRTGHLRRAFSVLRRVSSPHLPAALELLNQPDGSAWLVSAFIPGQALAAGPVAASQVVREAQALVHALRAVHAVGTHHGDVSLGNVIATPEGAVVLTDFGQLGCFGVGTPGFLAPEVLRGGGGPASDLFALGCLLCARLWGELPWRDPNEVLKLSRRGAVAVRERIEALARRAGSVPRPLRALVEHLLEPDPSRRIVDLELIARHLATLEGAQDPGAAVTTWWLPARWPYHGADLEAHVAALLSANRPRLVVVAGAPGSGRGRIVEELVLALQLAAGQQDDGPAARLCAPRALGRALGQPGGDSWLEAWIAEPRGESGDDTLTEIVGTPDEPTWPGELGGDDSSRASLRAAVLRGAASMATRTLIVPASAAVGEALGDAAGVLVLRARPWDRLTMDRALEGVLELQDRDGATADELREAWIDLLFDLTGGWPGRVVQAVELCARQGLERPEPGELGELIAARRPSLDAGLARRVVESTWSLRQDRSAPTVVDGDPGVGVFTSDGEPHGWAVTAARRVLGDALRTLARERLREGGDAGSLALALDADEPALVERWLLARDEPRLPVEEAARAIHPEGWSGPDVALARLVAWMEEGGAVRVDPSARAVLVRQLLRAGDPGRAHAIAVLEPAAAVCRLLAARALEQLGRASDALITLESRDGVDEALVPVALGLRWRALTDLGRAAEAELEARAWAEPEAWAGRASAEAALWAGLAALHAGEGDRARRWLSAARRALTGDKTGTEEQVSSDMHPTDAGLLARIEQVDGNIAHAGGDFVAASRRYERAAKLFSRAGEGVGGILLAANLAAFALIDGELGRGLRHGRAAFRSLLARGRLQALPAVAVNLVQLLARVGRGLEAARITDVLAGLVEARDAGDAARARLARAQAEVALLRARAGTRAHEFAGATAAFVASAQALEHAGLHREALEAWLRAAALARHGDLAAAQAHFARARSLAEGAGDVDTELALALAELVLASAAGEREAFAAATTHLRELPGPDELARTGRLAQAWHYDLSLWQALEAWGTPPADPRRRGVTRRLSGTLEILMSKVDRLEQQNVRDALTDDVGPPRILGELLTELESTASPEPAPEPAPAPAPREATWPSARLLQTYRRLAREDAMAPLLAQVVDAMMELCDAERGVVVLAASHAPGGEAIEVARELAVGADEIDYSRSIVERVLAEGQPILSVDAAADDRFDGARSISHLNLRSVVAVPLVYRGQRIGAAYVDHRLRRGAFDEADLARIEEFASLAALAIVHARTLAQLDARTGELAAQREELARLLEERESEVRGLREEVRDRLVAERKHYRGMVGGSSAMQAVFRLIDRLADADVPVVIYGESGTGKELVARAIHDGGGRQQKPFVAENCGAIPETLLESVLFGHAKGAFTGAHRTSAGLFEAADGGTIFLDEIGEMSPVMQTKLLRVLQEGVVRRVGESRERAIDVRVIAASNRDLDAMVAAGAFRQDLYYRVQVVKIELPALRVRTEDLAPLIEHFLARYDRERRLTVSAATMRALARYPWPGNVRELENEVQRWVVLADGRVEPKDLSPAIAESEADDDIDPDDLRLRPRLDRLERQLVDRALERTGGNQTRAAELLGLSRYGLQKKLRRLQEVEEAARAPKRKG